MNGRSGRMNGQAVGRTAASPAERRAGVAEAIPSTGVVEGSSTRSTMSVMSSPASAAPRKRAHALEDALGGVARAEIARQRLDQRDQAVVAEHLAVCARRLADAVGVEHDPVAGARTISSCSKRTPSRIPTTVPPRSSATRPPPRRNTSGWLCPAFENDSRSVSSSTRGEEEGRELVHRGAAVDQRVDVLAGSRTPTGCSRPGCGARPGASTTSAPPGRPCRRHRRWRPGTRWVPPARRRRSRRSPRARRR